MKKLNVWVAGLLFLLLSTGIKAQTKTGADFFAGKWNVIVKGTPNGDAKLVVVLEKKDKDLTGTVQDSTGKELSKLSKVDVTDTAVTVYFTVQSYDVNLVMNKKDDDHVIGSMMSMFDAEGERVKEGTKVTR